jgi:hypothetical protein
MSEGTYLNEEYALKGSRAALEAATTAASLVPGKIARIREILATTSWGDGADSREFKEAHAEVRGGLDLAEQMLALISEAAQNVVTGVEETVATDKLAKSLIDGVPLLSVTHLRS